MKAKTLIFIPVVFLFFSCQSTNLVPPTEYYTILNFPGLSKDVIFDKANLWMVRTFNKADSVIEYSNKDMGTVSGKYSYDESNTMFICGKMFGGFGPGSAERAKCFITIEVKDEKIKFSSKLIEVFKTDLFGDHPDWYPATEKDVTKTRFDAVYSYLVRNLQSFIQNQNDDW